jgi:hypothetical protein
MALTPEQLTVIGLGNSPDVKAKQPDVPTKKEPVKPDFRPAQVEQSESNAQAQTSQGAAQSTFDTQARQARLDEIEEEKRKSEEGMRLAQQAGISLGQQQTQAVVTNVQDINRKRDEQVRITQDAGRIIERQEYIIKQAENALKTGLVTNADEVSAEIANRRNILEKYKSDVDALTNPALTPHMTIKEIKLPSVSRVGVLEALAERYGAQPGETWDEVIRRVGKDISIDVTAAKKAGVSEDLLKQAGVTEIQLQKAKRGIRAAATAREVRLVEYGWEKEAQKEFEKENVQLPGGTWMPRAEVDKIKKESPGYYTVLTTEGYGEYENKFKSENTLLPDKVWISNETLKAIQNRSMSAYDILTTQGYRDYTNAINKAIALLEPYRTKKTGSTQVYGLSGNLTDAQTAQSFGIKGIEVSGGYRLSEILTIIGEAETRTKAGTKTGETVSERQTPSREIVLSPGQLQLVEALELLFDRKDLREAVKNYVSVTNDTSIYSVMPNTFSAYYTGEAKVPSKDYIGIQDIGIVAAPGAGAIGGTLGAVAGAVGLAGLLTYAGIQSAKEQAITQQAIDNYVKQYNINKKQLTSILNDSVASGLISIRDYGKYQERFDISTKEPVREQIAPLPDIGIKKGILPTPLTPERPASERILKEPGPVGQLLKGGTIQEPGQQAQIIEKGVLQSSVMELDAAEDSLLQKLINIKNKTRNPVIPGLKSALPDTVKGLLELDAAVADATASGEITQEEAQAYRRARERQEKARSNAISSASAYAKSLTNNLSDSEIKNIIEKAVSSRQIKLGVTSREIAEAVREVISKASIDKVNAITKAQNELIKERNWPKVKENWIREMNRVMELQKANAKTAIKAGVKVRALPALQRINVLSKLYDAVNTQTVVIPAQQIETLLKQSAAIGMNQTLVKMAVNTAVSTYNQALAQNATQAQAKTQAMNQVKTLLNNAVKTKTATQTQVNSLTKSLENTLSNVKTQTATRAKTATQELTQEAELELENVGINIPTLPLLDIPKETMKKLKKPGGKICWRQGFGWWVIKYPYKTEKDMYFTRKKPAGAYDVKGVGSAYRTIQALSGNPQILLTKNLGIVDVTVKGTSISFKRKKTRTAQDKPAMLKGVRR